MKFLGAKGLKIQPFLTGTFQLLKKKKNKKQKKEVGGDLVNKMKN